MLRDRIVEGFIVGDIEGDWLCKFDALGELLCTAESSAGCIVSVEDIATVSRARLTNSDLDASIAQDIQGWSRNKARTAGMVSVWGQGGSYMYQRVLTASKQIEAP